MSLVGVPLGLRFTFSTTSVTLAAALSILILAGCAGVDRREFASGALPTRIGDARPAAGVAIASRMPVQGIDVSSHNGDIDWPAVRQAGISFAYLKTTEGGDYADSKFFEYWKEAAEAGIHRGAYHFMYWCRPADQQALFFMVNVPNDANALPPVLDLEWNNESRSCPIELPPGKAIPMIRTLLAAMEARTGKRPIIYTDANFYRDILSDGAFADYPFWLRSTETEPGRLYPGRRWTYWQFTATGRVPGIRGDVDRNVFNGSTEQWERWLVEVKAVRAPATAQVSRAAPSPPSATPRG
jgi:lysozyme